MLQFIYRLVDPRTGVIAYIGITDNPNRRFQAHLDATKANNRKRASIEQLQSEHLEPRMEIIETVETREKALEREKYWIQWCLQQGIILVNVTSHVASKKQDNNITIQPDTPSHISYPKIDVVNGVVHPGVVHPGVVNEDVLRKHIVEDIKRSALYLSDNASDSSKEVFRTHWLKW